MDLGGRSRRKNFDFPFLTRSYGWVGFGVIFPIFCFFLFFFSKWKTETWEAEFSCGRRVFFPSDFEVEWVGGHESFSVSLERGLGGWV